MLAGRTIMAMLAVLLQMLAAGNSQATPDSGAILRSARRAQAAFESTRTRSLPERPGGWSDICGQRIGRICYWYESDDDEDSAPPEPARIREARARLLAALREAGAALPGDEWIVGQRVRYLLEDSQPASAALVAAQCRAALWWCEVLAGLVRHATGDFAAADSTFATALADMPADERCRWGDLSPLLEGELAERYRRLDCDARAAALLARGQRSPHGALRPRGDGSDPGRPPHSLWLLGGRPARRAATLRVADVVDARPAQVPDDRVGAAYHGTRPVPCVPFHVRVPRAGRSHRCEARRLEPGCAAGAGALRAAVRCDLYVFAAPGGRAPAGRLVPRGRRPRSLGRHPLRRAGGPRRARARRRRAHHRHRTGLR